jgi:dUTP pyrophosphatase
MDTLHIDGPAHIVALYETRANHSDDAGLDLILPEDLFVSRGRQATLDFGIRCMRTGPDDQRQTGGYYLYPRSSISKTPFRMANSVGIIDAGYRGNIMAKIDNTGPCDMTIKAGERLFQICMPDLRPFNVVIGGVDMNTERGTGGFGSTNSKLPYENRKA